MARFAPAKGSIEDWLRTMPGPMYSEISPRRVCEHAHTLYAATCSEPVELSDFIDAIWSRGLVCESVGNRYWLKLPGKTKAHLQVKDTPTRISG